MRIVSVWHDVNEKKPGPKEDGTFLLLKQAPVPLGTVTGSMAETAERKQPVGSKKDSEKHGREVITWYGKSCA